MAAAREQRNVGFISNNDCKTRQRNETFDTQQRCNIVNDYSTHDLSEFATELP